MGLRVSGKNMDVGESLRIRAVDTFDAIVAKYFEGDYDGSVILQHDGGGFRADCVVQLDTGVTLQGTATAAEPIAAFEIMSIHLEKRLRRYKRKLKSYRRRGDISGQDYSAYILAAPHEEEVEEDYSPPIIAETTKNLRSLSVSEAVMELDLNQLDVVVFRRAGHEEVNVVYRRSDGNIGWIDPALLSN